MSRTLLFTAESWTDYEFWQTHDRKTLKRINALIREAMRTPFEGTGRPKPLSGDLKGFWSRRIDEKNRLVYAACDDRLEIVSCRYHYDDH
jgi:toxin YoeB